jgi:DNA recombination protein Rad52
MFTSEQTAMLIAPLNREHVSTRKQGGRQLSYIEGWHAIAEANRIFGFGGWTRETYDVQMVAEWPREIGETKQPGWGVSYICRVRVTVGDIIREGCGAGHGIDRDKGLAHESAIKEAETDAMKRALMTFGNQFGLALYDREQTNVTNETDPQVDQRQQYEARQRFIEGCRGTIAEIAPDKLRAWWDSDAQKAARRRYDLSPGEVELLKALVIAKLPKKEESNEA